MNLPDEFPARSALTHSSFVAQRCGHNFYLAYIPPLLSRCVFGRFQARFGLLDDEIRCSHPPREQAQEIIGHVGSAISAVSSQVFAAAEFISGRPLTEKRLVRANALALGQKSSSLRRGPMWVGGSHPSRAWYVAPPADRMKPLLKNLIELTEWSHFPCSLKASLALCQLLLVHPFDDGNGRTARALFLGLGFRELGVQESLVDSLTRLWQDQGSALHGATLRLTETGRWDSYLELCESAIRDSIQCVREINVIPM